MLQRYLCGIIKYRDTVCRLMLLSKYPHLPINLVICPSNSSYMISAIVSVSSVGMSDDRISSHSENIVEVRVSCFSCCMHYFHPGNTRQCLPSRCITNLLSRLINSKLWRTHPVTDSGMLESKFLVDMKKYSNRIYCTVMNASWIGISDDRMQSYSVNIVEVEVSYSAGCVS